MLSILSALSRGKLRSCRPTRASLRRAGEGTLRLRSGQALPYPITACCYNSAVFLKIFIPLICLAHVGFATAQDAKPAQQPQVKVNMLNVCSPPKVEQQEISSALSRIPIHPVFSPDFEVDRGRSVLSDSASLLAAGVNLPKTSSEPASADFVRIRRDFAGQAGIYSTVQYSFSRDQEQMVETLVFRVREAKDLLQVAIEDSAATVTTAAAMLSAATPAARIKLERFGKSSVVLARCTGESGNAPPDQSAYQPLFSSASAILSAYRDVLGARRLVPEELVRIGSTATSTTKHQ